jgi:D-sedoheptulose 7-phosphate isomerase
MHNSGNIDAHLFYLEDAINEVQQALIEAKKRESFVFLFGNGGSHALASHFANDLLKLCGIKAICVSDMTSTMLAYMNDISPDAMFSSILDVLANGNDVILAFSCSGNSKNVVNALKEATQGIKKILFTGNGGGEAEALADIVLKVSAQKIFTQETVHSAICHVITEELSTEM